ncbi:MULTISPECIES: adenylate/guanylate cyclase domain-containing protein [Bradyrhizobium]|uniref:Class 3 adenylate cyclase n=1 Tax=Bradyrhizobium elkanii TaxID=29448 RepID=A0A8I2CA79_BRAEL|nr:adenylate/guanylate cyclase domain-containing protein [Bradyrhizobium elkanii]MBP1299347.1 class 3 adenylate cyclase [Bradyrhizobium elkanii]MCP1929797.1 class 3 adenylate cyclase [Bradyrhizobium elkanii]MCS3481946.1 class 3 adenylate cyclase [Bradyrhizobium elkanii]
MPKPHRTLFFKYFFTLFIAVVMPLALGAMGETWFGYREQRVHLTELLRSESRSAADRIHTFTDGIRDQLGWLVQFPWTVGQDEQHKVDARRLLRQVPAISSVSLFDGAGVQHAMVSRLAINRAGEDTNAPADPAVAELREGASKVWYGPVRYQRGSEPHMTIAVSGNRDATGFAIADVNLKLIWEVVTAIKIGETGEAFVIDDIGRLVAHPDISLVLRGDATADAFNRLRRDIAKSSDSATETEDIAGRPVVALAAEIPSLKWTVVVQQPAAEAFASIRASLWRSLLLVAIGTLLAVVLAYWLAGRMSGPIRVLEDGAQRVGAGQFDHRVAISTGDELERLATRFNEMAKELGLSKEKSDRINRLKRFLAPQIAELVESAGDDAVLEGQRREVVAVFVDLRDFTSFSNRNEPEVVMSVLDEYHAAVGTIIVRYGATLTNFAGDGLMLLINAPVSCPNPALAALNLTIDMRSAAQSLAAGWRERSYGIGLGIGLAMGPATVGRIGYEGQFAYTAIGNAVNLAARLCAAAIDGQILVDQAVASAVDGHISLMALGTIAIKGYDQQVPVFAVPPDAVATSARP